AVVADHRAAARPHAFDRDGAVAAEIARIAPELAVLVKVLRREEIDLERLDTLGHGAVACGAVEGVRGSVQVRADRLVVADVGPHRHGAPDALEVDVRGVLAKSRRADHDSDRNGGTFPNALHRPLPRMVFCDSFSGYALI